MSQLLSIWGCFFGPLDSSFSFHPSLEPASASAHLKEPFPRPVAPGEPKPWELFTPGAGLATGEGGAAGWGAVFVDADHSHHLVCLTPRIQRVCLFLPTGNSLPRHSASHSTLSVSPLGTWLPILYSSLKSLDVHSLIIKEVP